MRPLRFWVSPHQEGKPCKKSLTALFPFPCKLLTPDSNEYPTSYKMLWLVKQTEQQGPGIWPSRLRHANRFFFSAKNQQRHSILNMSNNSLRTFTPQELSQYTGTSSPDAPIYLAIKGTVFDVSKSRDMYVGGGYACFVGKDASRALGKSSLDVADCTSDVSDLTPEEVITSRKVVLVCRHMTGMIHSTCVACYAWKMV